MLKDVSALLRLGIQVFLCAMSFLKDVSDYGLPHIYLCSCNYYSRTSRKILPVLTIY